MINGNAEFVTSGQFDQVVSRTATQISVKNIKIEGLFGSGDLIVTGSWLFGADGSYEFMLVEDFDKENNILTVKRGVLDTIPDLWDDDIWFFVSNADDGLFSLTEYSAGDNVRASSLTVTPSSKLEHVGSSFVSMRSRAIRPYPPANVKINGEYWPERINGQLELTWSHRNRLQQTGGEILSWFDGGVMLESTVTYQLEVFEVDGIGNETAMLNVNIGAVNDYVVDLSSTLPTTVAYRIKLYSLRDTYESYQAFECVLMKLNSISKASNINAKYLSDTLTSASSFIKGYSSSMVDQATDIKLEFFNE